MKASSLRGKVVLVTRAHSQAGVLAAMLNDRGASPILAPAIRILPALGRDLTEAVRELVGGAFEWVIFTSPSGVEALLVRLDPVAGVPARVAAIGEGTASALTQWGIEPALVPSAFTTEALATAMPRGSGRVLLARADIASKELESALATKGWTPVRVDAYRTVLSDELPAPAEEALRDGRVDVVTFTSASTVDGFVKMVGSIMSEGPRWPLVACIGPVTAGRARETGLPVDAVADPHTIEGLVAALERLFASGRSSRRER
jgi:uroporphyrinogen-III synthase